MHFSSRILGAKIVGGIFLVGFGIAAVGFLIGTSVIILPAFGGYKYYKRRKIRRLMKRQQELMKMRSKNAIMELHRERIGKKLLYQMDGQTGRRTDRQADGQRDRRTDRETGERTGRRTDRQTS